MSDTWDGGYEDSIDDGHEFAEKMFDLPSDSFEDEVDRDRTLDDPRSERLDKGVVSARFKGTCVICERPINIGDAIAIQYQRAKSTGFFPVSSHDAPPAVEGWRHVHCPRSGPGGARVPARVPPPGNPPKESAVRRRLFPAEDDD